MNLDAKLLIKILAKPIQLHFKKVIIHYDPDIDPSNAMLVQPKKPINVIYDVNKIKRRKKHMLISIDTEKARVPVYTTTIQYYLEVLAKADRQEKEREVIQIGKEVKQSLFKDDMNIDR